MTPERMNLANRCIGKGMRSGVSSSGETVGEAELSASAHFAGRDIHRKPRNIRPYLASPKLLRSVGIRHAARAINSLRRAGRVPLNLKLAYTAFVMVTVAYYWRVLGPVNFLYYCDFALLLTLPAIWLESRLLVSTVIVGIMVPQALWNLDFLGGLMGQPLIGIASYMFRPDLPLFARALSTFHIWQPLLLVWLSARLGYDKRAFWVWTILAWMLMLFCFLWVPAPLNMNYVHGLGDEGRQTWLPALPYFLLWMATLPLVVIWPAHLLLQKFFAGREAFIMAPSAEFVERRTA